MWNMCACQWAFSMLEMTYEGRECDCEWSFIREWWKCQQMESEAKISIRDIVWITMLLKNLECGR